MLIGAEIRRRLPAGAAVEPVPGLVVKGKDTPVDAYLLTATDALADRRLSRPRGRGR
ncbi:hypothetical protein [Blastococcus sp. CT_GayMR16]|uniref:hypothetical protein n=1 Tax=Blastococcus sp. CT_GayMR16 TaxID=2559607 RepID=UPI001430DD4C|nr:hypothetical protein [Blastococcus sp. CT_GayMR16]